MHGKTAREGSVIEGRRFFCPLCEHTVEFKPFGLAARGNAQCSQCGSLERHRFAWLFLERVSDLLCGPERTMFHVAPEPCISARVRRVRHIRYTSADLNDRNAMVRTDLMHLPFPDRTFDIVFCSHVLEHVDSDRKAISELQRVLTRTGWAIFMVPITAPVTFEDPSITDPRMREAVFGQRDHVRRYGPDFEQRLAEGGFRVRRFALEDVVRPEEAQRMSLLRSDKIYFCTV